MGPGTFNSTYNKDASDRTPTAAAPDQASHARSEVVSYWQTQGNLSRGTATDAVQSVNHTFGTPTITHADAAASPSAPASTSDTSVSPVAAASHSDAQSAAAKSTANRGAGQWLPDHLGGAIDFAAMSVRGAGQSAKQFGSQVLGAVEAIPQATSHAASAIGDAAHGVATHPVDTAVSAAETAGTALWNGTKAVGKAMYDHPLQTAAIAAAAGAEVATVGLATPGIAALAGVGALGAGFATHNVWDAVSNVSKDSDKISPMFNATTSTAAQLKTAQDTVASDMGSATLDATTMATGIGLAAKLARAESSATAGTQTASAAGETASVSTEATTTGKTAAAGTDSAPTSNHPNRPSTATEVAESTGAAALEAGTAASGLETAAVGTSHLAQSTAALDAGLDLGQKVYDTTSGSVNLANLQNVGGGIDGQPTDVEGEIAKRGGSFPGSTPPTESPTIAEIAATAPSALPTATWATNLH